MLSRGVLEPGNSACLSAVEQVVSSEDRSGFLGASNDWQPSGVDCDDAKERRDAIREDSVPRETRWPSSAETALDSGAGGPSAARALGDKRHRPDGTGDGRRASSGA